MTRELDQPPMTASHGMDLGILGIERARTLATGGNAIVYHAHQPSMDREVVVKVLRAADDPVVRRRFEREQRAMGRLSEHPGIVPIYESGLTRAGDPYLVLPFYERGSLQDELVANGPFDPEAARKDMIAICDALQAAHDKGVVHRDLKPANILRANTGDPVLADFGIAQIMDSSASVSTALTLTPLYCSPEVFDGGEPAVSQDVYGLGAVLFALLNGRPAFDNGNLEKSVLALMRRISKEPLPPLPIEVPPGVVAAARRAMSKRPEDRYRSVQEFGDALRTAHDYVVPAAVPRRQITTRPVQKVGAPLGYASVIRPIDTRQHQAARIRQFLIVAVIVLVVAAAFLLLR